LYLLIKGDVAIRYKPYDGPLIILTRLRAGDVFGWSAMIGSRYYTSSILSESQVDAVRIQGTHFLSLIQEHPETGKIILERFARAVSPRWENVREQVQSILNSNQTK
jgi:CRP-like cAMP-binding protein